MATDTCPLYSILLAAGASSRYGSPKQLARIAGRTMLQSAIETVSQVTQDRVILVLGAHAPELRMTLSSFRGIIAINPHWREGLASSIRTAVAQLPVTAAAAMIVLADQPSVTAGDLNNLVRTWQVQPRSLVAASYEEVVGVPAIFPRHSFPDLLGLRGDAGARQLLSRHADEVLRVTMPNARLDIDRPEDLARIGAAR